MMPHLAAPSEPGKRIKHGYVTAAVITFNMIIIFLLANLVSYALLLAQGQIAQLAPPASDPIGQREEDFKQVYPNRSIEEIRQLLNEMDKIWFTYSPFVQYRERPYRGTYVNVDQHGFRRVDPQGPWPPQPQYWNIFLFGGSTTFGYGLTDDETIAAFLQERLATLPLPRKPRIYNFGRGGYYSSQERALLGKLLVRGHRPDLAIFIDGLNEFLYIQPESDLPGLTPQLRALFAESPERGWDLMVKLARRLPIYRLLSQMFLLSAEPPKINVAGQSSEQPTEMLVQKILNRYATNKRMIEAVGNALGIRCVFVWQPIPYYGYDLSHHLFAEGLEPQQLALHSQGYTLMQEFARKHFADPTFLWAADLQAPFHEPLYIDEEHYTAKFGRVVADFIAGELQANDLLPLK